MENAEYVVMAFSFPDHGEKILERTSFQKVLERISFQPNKEGALQKEKEWKRETDYQILIYKTGLEYRNT